MEQRTGSAFLLLTTNVSQVIHGSLYMHHKCPFKEGNSVVYYTPFYTNKISRVIAGSGLSVQKKTPR